MHDSVLEVVAAGARALVPGDPLDPSTKMGPLISESHRDKVLGYVAAGEAEGARRVTGSPRPKGGAGDSVHPTVFPSAAAHRKLPRAEILGLRRLLLRFGDR